MTGSGSFCPAGRKIVAFKVTPSRIGTRVPHWKSTSCESAANAAAARATRRTKNSTAERKCAGIGILLESVNLEGIVEQI